MASSSETHSGSTPPLDVVQFGPFELNRRTGELRKQGVRIRLQPKPLQLLYTLIENPGVVISREQLKLRLWPEDTFVDFESGVNTAVNRLRLALGDSAEHPRYVETVSRLGYRFLAPAEKRDPSAAHTTPSPPAPIQPRRVSTRLILALCAVSVIAFSASIRFRSPAVPVRFRQITFRRGQVSAARFVAGGQSVTYAAQWETEPRRLYEVNVRNPASRPLGFENLALAAVSRSGELALLRSGGTMNINGGTLSHVAIEGGPFTQIAENVSGADWSADGNRLAMVRVIAGAQQLEFPIGQALYRTSGWLSNVRVSPSDREIAFIDHPVRHDDAGEIRVVDTNGRVTTLTPAWGSASGLAWKGPDEIWFTAARDNEPRSVWAVTHRGAPRPVGQAPGVLTLRDIAPDGRVLLTVESRRLEMAGARAGEAKEQDYSLTDWSRIQQISPDGELLLFDESGEGSGWRPVAYLRRTRTGETVRLREGLAQGFTRDGSAVVVLSEDRTELWLLPVSGGMGERLPSSGLTYQWARPFPHGDRLLVLANVPQQPLRLYVQDGRTGKAEPFTGPMMVRNAAVAPDGESVAILTPDGALAVYPTGGGPPRMIPSEAPLAPIRWSNDGQWLFAEHLRSAVQSAADVSRLNPATGQIRLWRRLTPEDPIGVNSITGVSIADDEKSYAYSYRRVRSDLFIAESWK